VELATCLACGRSATPTLPDLVDCLLDPAPLLAAMVRTDAAGLAADGRTMALKTFSRLVKSGSPGAVCHSSAFVLHLGASSLFGLR
jgi:hypothetical protein